MPQTVDDDRSTPPLAPEKPVESIPAAFGRYRVTAKLGSGGFGVVYRAVDVDLQRDVAIKVPRADRITSPEDADRYLAEARIVASLDHPGIVPAYDFGRTDDGRCYLVSKFIEGTDLKERLKLGRLKIAAWEAKGNEAPDKTHWSFTIAVVSQELRKLYPEWKRVKDIKQQTAA